jgi:hypothetical protein
MKSIMTPEINDGGPAFPGEEGESGHGPCKRVLLPNGEYGWIHLNQGMSLRDYLASKEGLEDWDGVNCVMSKSMAEALAGEAMPDGGWANANPIEMFRFEAKWRAALKYIRADAMIAQRDKA